MSRLWMLVQIAYRNLLASPINLIIGGLILVGTMLFVVFGALLDSLNQSMTRSVVGSLAGHVQIYSAASQDELALFGTFGSDPDLSAVTDFPRIKAELEALPGVQTVVPMGLSGALITSGNIVDVTLERLRGLVRARAGDWRDPSLAGVSDAELDRQIAAVTAHLRQMIRVLEGDARKAQAILAETALDPAELAALEKVNSDAFWDGFSADPYAALEFLENRIAPQVTDASLVFLRYLGTDLDAFQRSFDRMEIVDGTPVPEGQRGFLVAKFVYEEQLKLKHARRLDKLKDGVALGRSIATDEELARFVKENRSQTRDIVLQLDGLKTARAVAALQGFLGSEATDLPALLSEFFDTTDATIAERHAFFYRELAPLLQLYKVRVGDTLTIKTLSRGGGLQAVNVKVYGTFAFKGLEKSPLAGTASLMDLMSFRDLYGYLTVDKKEELARIREDTGAREVSRENAEDELFGQGAEVVAEATPGVIDADGKLTGVGRALREEDLMKRVYSREEIESGVVLNAAVMLTDASRIPEMVERINRLSKDRGLGITAVSWQRATGILGQTIGFLRGMLIIAIAIIFGTAMIIINNAMMMATLQRTKTIGTMRAIGAQRSLVMGMVLLESTVLGILFGGVGVAFGVGIVALLGKGGIPAPNDVAYFLFSGPRLLPQVSTTSVVVAVVLILLVTLLSTLIPAILATRVSPLTAMQSDE